MYYHLIAAKDILEVHLVVEVRCNYILVWRPINGSQDSVGPHKLLYELVFITVVFN